MPIWSSPRLCAQVLSACGSECESLAILHALSLSTGLRAFHLISKTVPVRGYHRATLRNLQPTLIQHVRYNGTSRRRPQASRCFDTIPTEILETVRSSEAPCFWVWSRPAKTIPPPWSVIPGLCCRGKNFSTRHPRLPSWYLQATNRSLDYQPQGPPRDNARKRSKQSTGLENQQLPSDPGRSWIRRPEGGPASGWCIFLRPRFVFGVKRCPS